MIKALPKVFKILIFIAYPLLIFWALKNGIQPRFVSILIFIAAIFQFSSGKIPLLKNVTAICLVVLIICLWLLNNDFFLKLYPVIINLSLLAFFGLSLKYGPPVAEKFARLKNQELSARAIAYCRKVTMVWCVFFIINGGLALASCFLPINVWVLYNGLIAYILIGSLMAGEFCFRFYYRKKFAHETT